MSVYHCDIVVIIKEPQDRNKKWSVKRLTSRRQVEEKCRRERRKGWLRPCPSVKRLLTDRDPNEILNMSSEGMVQKSFVLRRIQREVTDS